MNIQDRYPELFLNDSLFPNVTVDRCGDYDIETGEFVSLRVSRHLHRFKYDEEIVHLPHLMKIANRGEKRKGHATLALKFLVQATGMDFWSTTGHMYPYGEPFFRNVNQSGLMEFHHGDSLQKMGYEFHSERPRSFAGGYRPGPQ